jgi:hypothetical protein
MFQKAISIQLIEPVVYIRGKSSTNAIQYNNIIRGFIVVHSSRLTVIQDIRLRLIGVAKTLWPEGIVALTRSSTSLRSRTIGNLTLPGPFLFLT